MEGPGSAIKITAYPKHQEEEQTPSNKNHIIRSER